MPKQPPITPIPSVPSRTTDDLPTSKAISVPTQPTVGIYTAEPWVSTPQWEQDVLSPGDQPGPRGVGPPKRFLTPNAFPTTREFDISGTLTCPIVPPSNPWEDFDQEDGDGDGMCHTTGGQSPGVMPDEVGCDADDVDHLHPAWNRIPISHSMPPNVPLLLPMPMGPLGIPDPFMMYGMGMPPPYLLGHMGMPFHGCPPNHPPGMEGDQQQPATKKKRRRKRHRGRGKRGKGKAKAAAAAAAAAAAGEGAPDGSDDDESGEDEEEEEQQ